MSCREFLTLFVDAWLAGELPARRRAACARHLRRCDACRTYTRGYRTVVALLPALAPGATNAEEGRPLDDGPLDEELVQQVLAAVRNARG